MPEYIDREAVFHAMMMEIRPPFAVVRDFPAADVAPVVHGEWVLDAKNHAYCSQCLYGRNIETQVGWNYCPNCGSKMILEDD